MSTQVIVRAPRDVRLESIPPVDRALGDYELRCRTELTALSPGTEVRIYSGLEAERFAYRVTYPFPPGYNNIGRVLDVGKSVTDYLPGTRVFTRMPHVSDYIVSARAVTGGAPLPPNVPPTYDVVVPVPDDVPSEQAAFSHLLALGFAALQRGQYRFGENVVVIGLGVVGLGTVCVARAAGARVAAIGNAPERLEVARQIGADEAWLAGDDDLRRAETFGGEAGVDLVVLCADAWDALRAATRLARRNTRIAVLGFPGVGQGPAPFDPFEPEYFYNRSLSYVAVSWMPTGAEPPEFQRFTYPRIYRYLLDMMARLRMDVAPLITHRMPIARIGDAYERVLQKDKSVVGVVFDWTDSGV